MEEAKKVTERYELAFLGLASDIEERIKLFFGSRGLEHSVVFPAAFTKLAYPIKHQQSAYFGVIHFSVAPEAVEKTVRDLEREPGVLRILLVRLGAARSEKIEAAPRQTEAPPAKSETVLSNKVLEQKLEEILK